MTGTVEMPGSCAISSNASSHSLSEYFMTIVSGPHSDHLRLIALLLRGHQQRRRDQTCDADDDAGQDVTPCQERR
ncbi:hypothetical protein [Nonomuraea sp. NPDC001831]|uniref:hypothetical protein n=1 Tax=Nonomuraea sp. NPDC001831 TaxID=3364340 RepID=UPI0036C374A6